MTRTVKGIFKRLHEANLLKDFGPDDYEFYSHRLAQHDREAGAYRWSIIPKTGCNGPTVASSFTARECTAGPVRVYPQNFFTSEIEIGPIS